MPELTTRRTFLKRALGSLLTMIGLSSGGYFYANRIEPSLLEITQQQISHPLIPKSFDGIKMIQFSDTHLGFQYNLSQFTKLIKKINQLHPDLIIFTGDLIDEPNKFTDIESLTQILQQLKAPLGKYCIYGNHDHGGYGTEIYRNIMENAHFTILLNNSARIKLEDGSYFNLLGIDDAMLGSPDIPLSLKKGPNHRFNLLLSHAPDLAETASQYPIHWQISGHSHGGQVKIPFIGALVIPPFAKIYQEGLYSIGTDRPLQLYVNRGIGTTRLPFRFMVKPELTIFTFKSEDG